MILPNAIDIVVVNYHSSADTLAALAPLAPWPNGNLWVVDNSMDASEHEMLKDGLGSSARLLDPHANLGFGKACNLAFESSHAEFILLLNPDARIDAVNIARLAKAMADHSGFGAMVPKIFWDPARRFMLPTLLPETPLVWLSLLLVRRFRFVAKMAFRMYLRWQHRLTGSTVPKTIRFASGGILMLRRRAVMEAGGLFDPSFFMFYEDANLSIRLRKSGWKIGIAPFSNALHEWRNSALKVPLMRDAHAIYVAKHFARAWRFISRFDLGLRPASASRGPGNIVELGSIAAVADLNKAICGRRIIALSPSASGIPAILGAPAALPDALSDADWARLASGRYYLALSTNSKIPHLTFSNIWMAFDKC